MPRGIYTRKPKLHHSPYADISGEEFAHLQYVNRKTKLDPSTGCWNWEGPFDEFHYGLAKVFYIHHRAHRLAYRLLAAEIPEGLVLDHLCRNTKCCNPKHLEPVTIAENNRRGMSRFAAPKIHSWKTHCPRGHPYSGENLRIQVRKGFTSRQCRACRRIRWQLNKS